MGKNDAKKLLGMNRFLVAGLVEDMKRVKDETIQEWLQMLKDILGWHKEDLETELKGS